MSHTPTPWKVVAVDPNIWGGLIEAANGKNVALYYADKDMAVGLLQGKANAEFTVRACNAHEELLAGIIPPAQPAYRQ